MTATSPPPPRRISSLALLLLLLAIAILGALTSLATAPFAPPLPAFERFALPCDIAWGKGGRSHIPMIDIPPGDHAAGNGLACVFVQPLSRTALEVTYVFRDEDHPWRAIDNLYDRYRWHHYGRVADVETVIVEDLPDARPCVERIRVHLPGMYANGQPWDVFLARHFSGVLVVSSHPSCGEAQPPRLRVATWNHLMEAAPPPSTFWNADSLSSDPPASPIPLYAGSRADVEAIFQGRAAPLPPTSTPREPRVLCEGCPSTPHPIPPRAPEPPP